MKYIGSKLSRQLLVLILIVFSVLFLLLGVVLPKTLLPVAEKTLYNYLSQPLEFIESDIDESLINSKVGYLYIINGRIVASDNLYDVIDIRDVDTLMKKISDTYGKFVYEKNTYYYYTIRQDQIIKVAIANDDYINETKADILSTSLPVILITFLVIALALIFWSSIIVRKITKLKSKVDHIDDDEYDHRVDMQVDDEIKSLAVALEDMRISLKNQEKYRNQMYQNISHDFKTPLTVIKSYIEAVDDGVEDPSSALAVIKEETYSLEYKVHSLLYLNKLDYLKEEKQVKIVEVDISKVIESSLEKFKFRRKDVEFIINIDKNAKFYGTYDLFETIIDNLLTNFMRYADKQIKITVTKNKIVLYNDGPTIDEDFLKGIFTPFRKGIKGEFGLGLSIVKKSANLIGYDVTIKNHNKKGVSFIITKGLQK